MKKFVLLLFITGVSLIHGMHQRFLEQRYQFIDKLKTSSSDEVTSALSMINTKIEQATAKLGALQDRAPHGKVQELQELINELQIRKWVLEVNLRARPD